MGACVKIGGTTTTYDCLPRFGLRSTSNFLDVGANQGLFLRGIEEVAPLGHHIAYEPLPSIYARLVQRFPTGIEIRQRALSDTEGQAEFLHVVGPGLQGFSNLVEGGLGKTRLTRLVLKPRRSRSLLSASIVTGQTAGSPTSSRSTSREFRCWSSGEQSRPFDWPSR